MSFHPAVDSRRLLARSAAPRSERRAQIGLFSGEVASGKSQDWRVAPDMLPGGGLAEATTPLLREVTGVVFRALRPQTAYRRFVAREHRLMD